jgi:hypothetical protein
MEHYDWDKVDEVVLALMYLTLHDGSRAWKGFDWDALDRLFAKGWISDPRNKAKSVQLTEEGVAQSRMLFERYFSKDASHRGKAE